ncbi:PAS domain-containing protein [Variovorax ginsengisoli]|uniref:histidine kinase n=1 Tax=Variovorax ginsengisoli TaxID=363844 RepID=A0ABT9SD19_9BURK|nr:PAS domain-containing protein [Variovorax ginsengisoli]MDP9902246.1 signal transduction histidine kinase [Variovorax ginsengisoli]
MKFLEGGGDTGRLLRQLDWSNSPLGPPSSWPAQLRTLVGLMLEVKQGVLIVWGPSQVTLYNDHYAEMLGARHPSAMGQPFCKVWYEIWDRVEPIISAAYAGRSTQMDDIAFEMLRNGYPEETHFSFSYTPVRDDDGAVLGMFCACSEITQRVISERAVAAQARQLESLFDASPSFMAFLEGPEHRFSLTNASYRALIGHRDPIGKTVREALPEVEGQGFFEMLDEAYHSGRAVVGSGTEIQFRRTPDAPPERRFVNFIYQPLQAAGKAVNGILVVGADVTDQLAISDRLTRDNASLAQRAADTEEQLRQAQKMEAVGQLTGGIAHDFNNMLQGIVLPLQVIRKRLASNGDDTLDRYIDAGIASARRASALTQRLLAFSRRQALDERVIEVADSIYAIEPLLRSTCGENIALSVRLADNLWPVKTDVHQFESALLNLAINARDAMPGGGTLSLEAENVVLSGDELAGTDLAAGEFVQVCVIDTGVGMPPSVLSRAFDPFYTTKPLGQGTGLGLSMVYGYLRQTGGYASIDSIEGKGTCVRLCLPRSLETGDAGDLQQAAVSPPEQRGQSVLIAEDDAVVRMVLVDLLRERGWRVTEATDGTQAMALLAGTTRFDLLLSDVGLPGPNGRQVADYARSRWPRIRILLMTGYAAEVATKGSFLEFDMALIVKPFDHDALLVKVEEVMQAAG